MTSRHHHYLSKFYLSKFAIDDGRRKKLIVIDIKEKKHYATNPRNVGGVRDFNRVTVEGLDQNVIEMSLAKFEDKVANAFIELERTQNFSGESRVFIINYIALLAIRSPKHREVIRKIYEELAYHTIDFYLSSKEQWESRRKILKENSIDVDEDITYEKIKEYHDSKKYTISVSRERYIELEFDGINEILPYLFDRKWILVRNSNSSGKFITTDRPVNLTWKEPMEVPLFYRNSPGFGRKNTRVIFPVSQELMLIGEFEGTEGTIKGDIESISLLNTHMLMYMNNQVYCPRFEFYFRGKENEILEGAKLPEFLVPNTRLGNANQGLT